MGQQKGTLKFCGKPLKETEWKLVGELAREFWGISRTELASTVCELLGWRRPNGKLKTVECGQFLKELEEQGLIGLPRRRGQGRSKSRVVERTEKGRAQEEMKAKLSQLGGVSLYRIKTSGDLRDWKELVDRYHYLGYKQAFGAQLRYLVVCGEEKRPLGCLQYSSPAWKVACRDRWIGWNPRQRAANLQRIVQNSRFLVLPWVKVSGLASHVLGRASRQVVGDWARLYGCQPLLLETFVEKRFAGTSYRAANWIELGQTQGRGRMDSWHRHAEPIKRVWVYPLDRRAREKLVGERWS